MSANKVMIIGCVGLGCLGDRYPALVRLRAAAAAGPGILQMQGRQEPTAKGRRDR